jgi:hypothetical protein
LTISRVANVLRWLRPALRRARPAEGAAHLQVRFVALYAFPEINGPMPGEKH